jgi:hypothetical protein
MTMKTVGIDELLSWAFVHELPKGGGVDGLDNANSAWRMIFASSWGKVSRFAELMTMVDTGSRGEGMWIEQGEPHEDAVAVGEAVAALADCDIVLPEGWNPLADWGEVADGALAKSAVAAAIARFNARTPSRRAAHLVSLVIGTAVLGREPAWDAEQPKVRMVMREGRPAWFRIIQVRDDLGQMHPREVDGYNPRGGRPHRGAYRKFEFADDPVGDILARLDRQLWAAALARLDRQLRPKLAAHRLRACGIEASPWPGGHDHPPVGLVKARRMAA